MKSQANKKLDRSMIENLRSMGYNYKAIGSMNRREAIKILSTRVRKKAAKKIVAPTPEPEITEVIEDFPPVSPVEKVVEQVQHVQQTIEPIKEEIITPAVTIVEKIEEVAEPIENTLLQELITPTDKDATKDARDIVEDLNEDVDYGEEDTAEDGKITTDPKQIRKEAHLKSILYVNAGSLGLNKVCGLVTGNFETTKYKISDDEKKMISDPLRQYIVLRSGKKQRSPGFALAIAIMVVVIPIVLLAVMDAVKSRKAKKEKQAQDLLNKKDNDIRDLFAQFNNNAPIATVAKEAPMRIVKTVSKGGKKGRHKSTCPKSKDKNATCNCK